MATTGEGVAHICNRALQKVGAEPISDIDEDTASARACKTYYEDVRDSLLRSYFWSFAGTRVALAPDLTAPAFGRTYAYTLPSDCLAIMPPDPEYQYPRRDWILEGGKILSNHGPVAYLRYVARVEDPGAWDPLFQEAVAAFLAVEIVEKVTQSNTKKAQLEQEATGRLAEARRVGAVEKNPTKAVPSSFLTVRYC